MLPFSRVSPVLPDSFVGLYGESRSRYIPVYYRKTPDSAIGLSTNRCSLYSQPRLSPHLFSTHHSLRAYYSPIPLDHHRLASRTDHDGLDSVLRTCVSSLHIPHKAFCNIGFSEDKAISRQKHTRKFGYKIAQG